jgi:Fe-S-cluster containining protein
MNKKEIELVKKATQNLNKTLDVIIADIPSCCKEGCDYCCYQSIEVLNWEADLIENYVKNNLTIEILEQVKENHKNWIEFYNDNTPDVEILSIKEAFEDFIDVIDNHNLACPFLIDKRCSIYPVRPISCRTHFVQDSPELCKKNKLRPACQTSKVIKARSVNALADLGDVLAFPLAYVCANTFGLHSKLKKIQLASIRMPELEFDQPDGAM